MARPACRFSTTVCGTHRPTTYSTAAERSSTTPARSANRRAAAPPRWTTTRRLTAQTLWTWKAAHWPFKMEPAAEFLMPSAEQFLTCLLYTSDAADDLLCVDLGGRRIIKKKK